MIKSLFSSPKTLYTLVLTSSLLVSGNISALALDFKFPGDSTPKSSVGGGTRGQLDLIADNSSQTDIYGQIYDNITFADPSATAPQSITANNIIQKQEALNHQRTDKLQALLPNQEIGRTISGHPSFFVYLPPSDSQEVFFSIQDESGKNIYQTTLKITGKSGIIQVKLPKSAPELEINKNYHWFFAMIAPGDILAPDSYSVTGWVKRVTVDNLSNINNQDAITQAANYAQAGIWYDTLNVLASAKMTQPDNITLNNEWRDLLSQVGLENLANKSLIEQL